MPKIDPRLEELAVTAAGLARESGQVHRVALVEGSHEVVGPEGWATVKDDPGNDGIAFAEAYPDGGIDYHTRWLEQP